MDNWSVLGKVSRNKEAAFVAVLALSAQVFHAQYVFFESGHNQGLYGSFNAWLYAIAVESAVFFFVLLGWAWVSWAFAIASVGVNVAYYTIAHGPEYGYGFMFDPAMVSQTWYMWLLAFVLPVAVAAFSHATEGHKVEIEIETKSEKTGLSFGWVRSLRDRLPSLGPDADLESSPVKEDPSPVRSIGPVDSGPVLAQSDVGSPEPSLVSIGPATSGLDLDDVDKAILVYLAESGPASKSAVGKSVDMTGQAMFRLKSGKRTGRLAKLEDAGLVYETNEGDWAIVQEEESLFETVEDLVLGSPGVYTNGAGA